MKKSVILALFFLLIIQALFLFSLNKIHKSSVMTYSELKNLVKSGHTKEITKVTIFNGESVLEVRLVGHDHDSTVVVPTELKEKLLRDLDDSGVTLDVHPPDKSAFWFSTLSSFFLPILLLVGFLFMFRSAQSHSVQKQHPEL